jgi:hypothetical protein
MHLSQSDGKTGCFAVGSDANLDDDEQKTKEFAGCQGRVMVIFIPGSFWAFYCLSTISAFGLLFTVLRADTRRVGVWQQMRHAGGSTAPCDLPAASSQSMSVGQAKCQAMRPGDASRRSAGKPTPTEQRHRLAERAGH